MKESCSKIAKKIINLVFFGLLTGVLIICLFLECFSVNEIQIKILFAVGAGISFAIFVYCLAKLIIDDCSKVEFSIE